MELQEYEELKPLPMIPGYFSDSPLLSMYGVHKNCILLILYCVFISWYFEEWAYNNIRSLYGSKSYCGLDAQASLSLPQKYLSWHAGQTRSFNLGILREVIELGHTRSWRLQVFYNTNTWWSHWLWTL